MQPGIEKYFPGHKENSYTFKHPDLNRKALSDSPNPFKPSKTSTPFRTLNRNNAPLFRTKVIGKVPVHTSAKDSGFVSQEQQTRKRKLTYTERFIKKLKSIPPEQQEEEMSNPQAETANLHPQSAGGAPEPQGTSVHKDVTKQIVMKYSRTLRHYVLLPSDLDNKAK